jgi:RNA polymerase-binding transcription factor DksA
MQEKFEKRRNTINKKKKKLDQMKIQLKKIEEQRYIKLE